MKDLEKKLDVIINNPLVILSSLFFYVYGKIFLKSISFYPVVYHFPSMRRTKGISLGKKVCFGKNVRLRCGDNGQIKLGNRVYFHGDSYLISNEMIEIGDDVLIGEFTTIKDSDHKYKEEGLFRDQGYITKPVKIGNNVWVGRGVMIAYGVTIGPNSIIGANSFVKTDVPEGTIYAGCPAQFIKNIK